MPDLCLAGDCPAAVQRDAMLPVVDAAVDWRRSPCTWSRLVAAVDAYLTDTETEETPNP